MGTRRMAWPSAALLEALKGRRNQDVPTGYLLRQLGIVLAPAVLFAAVALMSYQNVTTVKVEETYEGLTAMGAGADEPSGTAAEGGLASAGRRGGWPVRTRRPTAVGSSNRQSADGGVARPPGAGLAEPAGSDQGVAEPPGSAAAVAEPPSRQRGLAAGCCRGGVQRRNGHHHPSRRPRATGSAWVWAPWRWWPTTAC